MNQGGVFSYASLCVRVWVEFVFCWDDVLLKAHLNSLWKLFCFSIASSCNPKRNSSDLGISSSLFHHLCIKPSY